MKTIAKLWLSGMFVGALTACGAGNDTKLRQGAVAPSADSIDYSTALQQIYVGYFGRPADPAGLAYYSEALRAAGAPATLPEMSKAYYTNAVLKALIDGFSASQESRDLYPGDDASFVTAIYFNLFNRAPEDAGKAYWVGLIGSSAMTRANAALSIMAGSVKGDLTSIENKAAAAAKFTAALDSPARLHGYNGASANDRARAMLRQVGQDTRAEAFQPNIDTTVKGMAGAAAVPVMLAAANHSMALKPDGSLWVWGNNSHGELGNPALSRQYEPARLGDGYVSIAAGYGHSFALKADGGLYAWGWNKFGQLGDGSTTDVAAPKKIGTGYASVSTGYGHTLAIKFDRSLWAWGWNDNGQLGNGGTAWSNVPVRIGDGFSAVAAGFTHSLALKPDGSLWAWGRGKFGQQGDGTNNDSVLPHQIGAGFTAVAAGDQFSVALKSDGTLWAWGYGTPDPGNKPMLLGTGYSAISANSGHALALKADGSLWSWGDNEDGQLGNAAIRSTGTPTQVGSGYVAIAAGDNHSLAIKADGSLWGWGANDKGQLGNGRLTSENLPTLMAASIGGSSSTVPSAKAVVSSVMPLTAALGQETSFIVRGSNLGDDITFALEGCLTRAGAASGEGATRTFACTPLVAGSSAGVIKSAAGERLFDFSVTVGDNTAPAQMPAVASVSPSTATVNQSSTFTVAGSNLPDGLVLTLDGCTSATEISGGSASRRQFRCTPSSSGEKSGSIKTVNGTSLGKFSVTIMPAAVTPPPSSSISGVVSIAPVSGATVNAYAVAGGSKGSLLGTATTNASGEYAMQLGSYTGLALLEAQGGRYTDPATGAGTALSLIRSVVTVASGDNIANLTPFTEPVVANATKLGGGLSTANVTSTLQVVKARLGFDPVTTKPADPNQAAPASASTSSITYAGLLGTASQYAGDNQEKTIPAIQEDISALLAALANISPMIAQSADNYWVNSRNVMGLSSNLGSGNNFTICYTGPYIYGIGLSTCTKTKPVTTCAAGKTAKDGVCVKTTTTTPTPGNPGQGTFVSVSGGTGNNAAQCVSIWFRPKDAKKGYYWDAQPIKNTCNVKIAIMLCHSPSPVSGTADSECRANGLFYTRSFWLNPGEVDDYTNNHPPGATVYFGACSGGKGSNPQIKQIGTNGDYSCY